MRCCDVADELVIGDPPVRVQILGTLVDVEGRSHCQWSFALSDGAERVRISPPVGLMARL